MVNGQETDVCVNTGADVTVIQSDLVDDYKRSPMAEVEIKIGHLKLKRMAAVIPNDPTASGVLLSV